jgi:hypothetical protein
MLQYDGKDQANIRPLINLIAGQCCFATERKRLTINYLIVGANSAGRVAIKSRA